MKKLLATLLITSLLVALLALPAAAASYKDTATVYGTDWQDTYIIANINVKDAPFNAKGDGVTDDTAAIQAALDSVEGGGIVYIPAGEYVIKGTLYIPNLCTLVGDWAPPTGETGSETVLLAYAGRGSDFGVPFIGLGTAATLKNISVYYPEQTAEDIQPYPYTVGFYGVSCLVSGITLYNSYNGINTHFVNGSAQHVFHVYGTPLNIGASFDINLEVSELAYVDFNIDYWANSGRTGAPVTDAQQEAVRTYTRNAKAIECGRIDDMYLFDINVDPDDYDTGIYFYQNAATDSTVQGGAYGHMQKLHQTTVYVAGISNFGVQLDFVDDIVDQSDISYSLATGNRTTASNIRSVKEAPYNAAGDGVTDDTAAIKACIADVAAMGGGMVYIPAGQFKVTESITVPTNVELRGALSGPHTAFSGICSQLNVFADSQGQPAVILQEASGIHGLTFWYPENQLSELVEMPYTIQGAGNDIWISNTTFVNCYDAIDLATNRCDRFYVGNTWGTAMRYGIRVGAGSDGGIIENTLFTYGIWQETKNLHGNPDLSTMQNLFRQNSIAYAIGDCTDLTGWSVFGFGNAIGTWLYAENGRSAENAVFYRLGLDTPWCETSLKIEQAVSVEIYGLSTASHQGPGVWESEGLTGTVNIYGQNLWGGAGNDIRDSGKVNIYAAFDGFFSNGSNIQAPVVDVQVSSESFNFEFVCDNVRDQFRYTTWKPDVDDATPTLTFALDGQYTIRSVIISHGSVRSGDRRSNATSYTIQASLDGHTYTDVLQVSQNSDVVAVHNIPATQATHMRIVFTDTGRTVDLEVGDVKFLTQEVDLSEPDDSDPNPTEPNTATQPGTASRPSGSNAKGIMFLVLAVCVCALTIFIIAVDIRRRKKN